jgi:uncharacterized protein YbjQ (UPF0145 family)
MTIRLRRALFALAWLPLAAQAADDVLHLPFEPVLQSEGSQQLDGSVKFFLAGQRTPKAVETKGEFVSNKKANGFGKGSDVSCQRAALSALLSLQDRAKELGGNAVVNIVSYYKKVPYSSPTEYECHDGGLMSGVAFKGTVVRLAK